MFERMKKCQINNSQSKGFTLIEMAIVILISGMFIATAVRVYTNETKKHRFNKTIANLEKTQAAVDEFFSREGRYPCPADPRLPPGDSMFGREWCTDAPPLPPHVGVSPNIVYETLGSRDADNDGALDPVAIGIVPFVTLSEDVVSTRYSVAEGYDAYNYAYSYAVSDIMTRNSYNYSAPVPPMLGVIDVRDANANSVITPVGTAQYVVFSHGETGEGAYTRQGTRIGNCFIPGLSVIPPAGFNPGAAGITVELENCDNNDVIFVKELRSFADNDNFNDDILFFAKNLQFEIWRVSAFSPSTDTYYYNTNMGSISTGSLPPTSLLYVSGSIRAQNEMNADVGYCPLTYTSAGECVQPQFLGGSGYTCGLGEVATGIENNELVCEPLLTGHPQFLSYCSAGEFMTGFTIDRSNGATAICDTP